MILPSGWTATAAVLLDVAAPGTVVVPPEPNDVSGCPLGSSRARPVLPLRRMSPLDSGTASEGFPRPGTELSGSDSHPLVPKVVSMLPGVVAAAATDAVAASTAPLATRLASRMPGTA